MKRKKQGSIRQKLINKYRLIILNEDTFEERFSLKLSRQNVYVFGGALTIVLIVLTSLLIAFTPLREYIPGYSSTALKQQAAGLLYKVDSLEGIYKVNDAKLSAMMSVMRGEDISGYYTDVDSILQTTEQNDYDYHGLMGSTADSVFRQKIENQDRFDINTNQPVKMSTVLFAPLSGVITNNFNIEEQHFAIDIAVEKNTPVKAIADGTVIFAEWSIDTGYVIIIDHGNNLLSICKHNSHLYKKQFEIVKSGEVIAVAGSDGALSTGTHLHFELWYNSYPIDPTNFMDFE